MHQVHSITELTHYFEYTQFKYETEWITHLHQHWNTKHTHCTNEYRSFKYIEEYLSTLIPILIYLVVPLYISEQKHNTK